MAGTFTITGLAAGLASGSKTIGPNTMTGSAVVGTVIDATLSTGDNTFAVPTSASACTIFISTTNTAVLKIRTNLDAIDGGLPINPAGPWISWPLAPGTTSVIVNAASGGASVELTII